LSLPVFLRDFHIVELSKPLLANSGLKAIPALGELMLPSCGLRTSPRFNQVCLIYVGGVLFDYGI
jgi:hypothetical protein